MDAVASPTAELNAPERRHFGVTPAIETGVLAIALAMAVATYFIVMGQETDERLLTPPVVALLLIANLLPCVALLVLIGRRVAMRRAARTAIGGKGRLHVRLVALFSVIASVPMLLTVIFASLMFQYGVEFWFSDRARSMLENASMLARASYTQILDRWNGETVTMAEDLAALMREEPVESPVFAATYGKQVFFRNLSESAIFTVNAKNEIQTIALVNPYERDLATQIDPVGLRAIQAGQASYAGVDNGRIWVVTPIPGGDKLYLYAARLMDASFMIGQTARARAVLDDYNALQARSRSLQLQFHAALFLLALLIVGATVWIALAVADRLVRPVNDLVGAARRVAEGDLTARVEAPKAEDEIGTLGNAFNQMTDRLQQQTNALVSANAQIETRRALIEAVMEGVTAGVISTGADRCVRLINSSAIAMLKPDEGSPVGKPLAEVAPELDALLDGDQREAVIQLAIAGETRTLAVKITRDEIGKVLTFDDITQQLLDQRRAAWADVARRIAHEIKNPLTPIQLAAERLQRRYGKNVDAQDTTFTRLTDTIVRQVGDLRRMVDEFSSFARMPKPVFRHESLVDLARQALFLHEVAHPEIAFTLDTEEPVLNIVCDRRQIGQALTNIVKNAVEAIEARVGEMPKGEVLIALGHRDDRLLTVDISDNGVGLPAERDRIVEPYMTTRSRGTGLGLAIVTKIVEEHFGTITFADRPGGGTVVSLCFDAGILATMAAPITDDGLPAIPSDDDRPTMLTRTGSSK